MDRPKASNGHPSHRAHPQKRPLSISAIHLTPESYEASSRPETPVQGLSTAELRLLRKLYDTGSKMVEGFRRVLKDYTGGAIDDTRLKTSIQKVVSGANTIYRNFSALTYDDIQHLLGCAGQKGKICYDKSKNAISISPYFHAQLDDLEMTLLRGKEAGNRVIIAHYISHAIKMARQKFKLDRLACDSEKDVSAELIPNIGYLSGTLDFAIGIVEGSGPLDVVMRGRNSGKWQNMNVPYIVILEAKRASIITQEESEAELFGQLRVLMAKHNEEQKLGILTDGFIWRLFHLDREYNLYFEEFIVSDRDSAETVLGLLVLLAAGIKPAETNQFNSPVWLSE